MFLITQLMFLRSSFKSDHVFWRIVLDRQAHVPPRLSGSLAHSFSLWMWSGSQVFSSSNTELFSSIGFILFLVKKKETKQIIINICSMNLFHFLINNRKQSKLTPNVHPLQQWTKKATTKTVANTENSLEKSELRLFFFWK